MTQRERQPNGYATRPDIPPRGRFLSRMEKNMAEMYVTKEDNLYYLRQTRFKQLLERGQEHPHDVCVVATSVVQMHEMADKHWPSIDYSAVEGQAA